MTTELRCWDSSVKNRIRSIICAPKSKPYQRVLLFPSDTCLDLREMVKNGAIDPLSTSVVAVERNKDVAKMIKSTMKELGVQTFVVLDCNLDEVELDEQFDFVYLDTCGTLNAALLNWLCTQVQKKCFANNCKITIAVSPFQRGGYKFFNNYKKFLKKEKKCMPILYPTYININESLAQKQQHRGMGAMLRSILGAPTKSWIYRNDESPVPMHVFSFKVRPLNTGLTQMFKFLSQYSDQELNIISSGIKAAIKRTKCLKKCVKKPEAPVKEDSTIQDLLKKLIERVEAVEKSQPFHLLKGEVYNLEESTPKIKQISRGSISNRILELFKLRPSLRASEVRHLLNIGRNAASSNLRKLEKEGLVQKVLKTGWHYVYSLKGVES